MRVRYDEEKEIYRDCRWCHGSGCLYCKAERDKEYKRQFPDGPVPVATFEGTTEGIAALKDFIEKATKPK